jgi:alcohol dehydrogenase class IV
MAMGTETSPTFQHLARDLRLFCGEDSLAALSKELKRSGCRRAVVVSGRSVIASPAMDLLRSAIRPVLVGESQAVRPNSPVPAVEEAARALRDAQADAVIAIGGGSAAVTARAAVILLAEQKPAQELCTRRLPNGQFDSPRLEAAKLPLFVIPTTPSTAFVKAGSAVHDAGTGQRLALFDPKTRAKALFLHPAFLRTAPADVVRDAAVNTLATAVEALESPRCDPVSEALLMHALRLLARHLHRTAPDDVAAREYMGIAAVLCGRGTDQAGGGLSSVLGHAIGHRAHVGNGVVNGIVLPHTMRFNAPATADTVGRIADALRRNVPGEGSRAADLVESLLARQPIPHRLRDIGLAEADLDAIAQAALGDFFISRNPRKVQGADDVRGILQAAW